MAVSFHELQTINNMVDVCAREHGQRAMFSWRKGEQVESVSYADFAGQVHALAAVLAQKTPQHAKIAIVGENSHLWLLSWFATVCAGRVAVPLDPQLPTPDMLHLLQLSGASLLLYAKGFEDVAAAFGQAVELGEAAAWAQQHTGDTAWPCQTQPEEIIAVVFTSGTTGKPKGVQLSHKNFMSDALSVCRHLDIAHRPMMILTPYYHTLSTTGMLAQLPGGSTVSISGGLRHLSKDMAAFQPEYMVVVPLLAEGMYKQLWDTVKKQNKEKQLRLLLGICDLLHLGLAMRRRLFKKVLAAFGGKLEWMLCGGAATAQECVLGFLRFGIEILPSYGLTECSAGVSINPHGALKPASVGRVMDVNEVKIEEGEILVRGDNVCVGYYQDEAAMKEACVDGWFLTGDLGYLDADNYLYITGRKKNLIILSNGKNVSPEGLEQKLMDIPLILEALVYEDAGEIAAELFLDAVIPDAAAQLDKELLALNRSLPVYQQITKTVLRDSEFPKTALKKIKRN